MTPKAEGGMVFQMGLIMKDICKIDNITVPGKSDFLVFEAKFNLLSCMIPGNINYPGKLYITNS